MAKFLRVTQTAPEAIYLQVSDDNFDRDQAFPDSHDGISWCADSVMECEVRYVREDIAASQRAEVVDEEFADIERVAQWLYRNGMRNAAATVRGQIDARNVRIRELTAALAARGE
jgi:hypothetical protein